MTTRYAVSGIGPRSSFPVTMPVGLEPPPARKTDHRSPRPHPSPVTAPVRSPFACPPRVAVGPVLCAGLVALSTVGCRRDASEGSTNDAPRGSSATVAIAVGAIPGRPGFDQMLRGVELAVERLNGSGTVRFEVRAPERSSTSALRIARSHRDDPAILGVVGHPESGNTLEALPVYADAEHDGANAVVAVSPTATSPRLTGASPWFFRVAPSDDVAGRFVARYVLDSLRARRAAIVYRNDSYGRDWARTFTDAFTAGGGTVTSRDPYLTGLTEWDAYAALLARQRPDVLLFPGDADDALEMIRALRDEQVRIPFLGGDGTGQIERSPDAVGARFVAFFRPEQVTGDEARRFLAAYRERFGEEPDMFSALSYDAALAIGRVVQSGARSRVAVRDALRELGGRRPALEGVGGPIAFDARHDVVDRPVVITTIRSPGSAPAGTVPPLATRRNAPVATIAGAPR